MLPTFGFRLRLPRHKGTMRFRVGVRVEGYTPNYDGLQGPFRGVIGQSKDQGSLFSLGC